jgi:LL-diaminopimelate aminotransferase
MTTATRLDGIGEYYFSQKLREIEELNKEGKNIINLGIGSPDLPPHPEVVKVLQEEATKPTVHGYQNYKGLPALRQAFAGWYKQWYNVDVNPDTEVLPLIGSKEGIMHICMTYLNEGDEALVPNPGYPTYRSAVKLAGGTCVDYQLKEENNYLPDFDALEKTNLSKVKLMWVNYPNMPTGQLPTKNMFEQLIAFGQKHNILICHDNPYSFILNEQPASLMSIDGAKDIALELNSLSKSQNMAGWRIGVLVASQQRIDEVLRFKSNMDSGMFMPLQLAAIKALSLGKDWYDSINQVYSQRREKVYQLLDLLQCSYAKEQVGLFMWAKIPSAYKNSYELADKILYQSNVFITPGGIFGSEGEQYIRISLCGSLEKFEDAIKRIADTLKK